MASYFRHVSAGGPTAAWAQARSLCWASKHLKINLLTDNELVSPWCTPKIGHSATGAFPAQICVSVHWEEVLMGNNPYVAQIAAGNLLCSWAVLRFKHIQRSTWSKRTTFGALGHCSLGKGKRDGVRGGFWWTMPQDGVSAQGVADQAIALRDRISTLSGGQEMGVS